MKNIQIAETTDPYGTLDTDELVEKLMSIKRRGHCSRECPQCNREITRVEPDAASTWCQNCGEVVEIEPLV